MIFPFLFVFSSRVAGAWTALRNRYQIFVTSLVAYLLISNLSYFPHYLSYFNELLVERKMGYKILVDSNLDWGQNEYYLKHYLTKNPEIMYTPNRYGLHIASDYHKLPTNKVFYPVRPQAGLIVIGVNKLVGIVEEPKNYQWIRENLKPVAHVAHSYLVFKIQPQDIEDIKIQAKPYSINALLDFQANSNNSLDYQWGGWSFPEREGTWTNGKEAHLFMELQEPVKHDLILNIKAVPFIHENHPQQVVDVLVNEELVTQLIFKLDKPLLNQYKISLPAKLINSISPLQITFRFSPLASPHSLGLGDDKRLLGLMLKKMKLVEDKTL